MTALTNGDYLDYRKIGEKFTGSSTRTRFGKAVVELVNISLTCRVTKEQEEMLLTSVKYLIRNLKWWEHIWIIPHWHNNVSKWRVPVTEVDFMAKSLLYTMAVYKRLEDHNYVADIGMAICDITQGFEVACTYMVRGGNLIQCDAYPRLAYGFRKSLRNEMGNSQDV